MQLAKNGMDWNETDSVEYGRLFWQKIIWQIFKPSDFFLCQICAEAGPSSVSWLILALLKHSVQFCNRALLLSLPLSRPLATSLRKNLLWCQAKNGSSYLSSPVVVVSRLLVASGTYHGHWSSSVWESVHLRNQSGSSSAHEHVYFDARGQLDLDSSELCGLAGL